MLKTREPASFSNSPNLASSTALQRFFQSYGLFLILGSLVIFVFYLRSPIMWDMPGRDSGVFLYNASQLLEGKVLYRDLWDHKPPLIYYLNAVGLLFTGGSLWGVWLVQVAFVLGAALVGFSLLKQVFGTRPAIVGSVAWIVSLQFLLDSGNYTEQYVPLFQFAALYLYWQINKLAKFSWREYSIGLTLGMTVLLRPNALGIWLAIGLSLLIFGWSNWRLLFLRLLLIAGGCLSVIGVVATYFASQSALDDFVEQVIYYNLIYSRGLPFRQKLDSLVYGLQTLSASGLVMLSLAAITVGIFYVLGKNDRLIKRLVLVAGVSLVLELGLASFSGYKYGHYFISLLPAAAVMVAFLCYLILGSNPGWSEKIEFFRHIQLSVVSIAVFGLCLGLSLMPLLHWIKLINLRDEYDESRRKAVEYVRVNSTPDQTVLVWGAETIVNFLSERPSPSRFSYHFALFTNGYTNPKLIQSFMTDLKSRPPDLIIDASSGSGVVRLDPRPEDEANNWYQPGYLIPISWIAESKEIFNYVRTNYEPVGKVGPAGWTVYRPKAARG